MGTGETVPSWFSEIQVMEHFGWTEKQLYEEVSLKRYLQIKEYFSAKGRVDKVREQQGKTRGKRTHRHTQR